MAVNPLSVQEESHTVTLTDSECLFIASLANQYILASNLVSEITFAGRIWHKVVPESWKAEL